MPRPMPCLTPYPTTCASVAKSPARRHALCPAHDPTTPCPSLIAPLTRISHQLPLDLAPPHIRIRCRPAFKIRWEPREGECSLRQAFSCACRVLRSRMLSCRQHSPLEQRGSGCEGLHVAHLSRWLLMKATSPPPSTHFPQPIHHYAWLRVCYHPLLTA